MRETVTTKTKSKSKTKKVLIIVGIVIAAILFIQFVLLNWSYGLIFKDVDNLTYMTIESPGKEIEITKKEDIDKVLNTLKSTRYMVKVLPETVKAGYMYEIKLYDKKGGAWYYRAVLSAHYTEVNEIRYYTKDIISDVHSVIEEIEKAS